MNRVTTEGLSLIRSYEGLRLRAYQDQVGLWTIGYGHRGSPLSQVRPGDTITQERAEQLFQDDVNGALRSVNALVTVALNDNQASALASFVFNLGASRLRNSHLLTYINDGMTNQAADAFLAWDHAGGVEVAGLKARRQAERALFLKPMEVAS